MCSAYLIGYDAVRSGCIPVGPEASLAFNPREKHLTPRDLSALTSTAAGWVLNMECKAPLDRSCVHFCKAVHPLVLPAYRPLEDEQGMAAITTKAAGKV